jgi:hypothetical protein
MSEFSTHASNPGAVLPNNLASLGLTSSGSADALPLSQHLLDLLNELLKSFEDSVNGQFFSQAKRSAIVVAVTIVNVFIANVIGEGGSIANITFKKKFKERLGAVCSKISKNWKFSSSEQLTESAMVSVFLQEAVDLPTENTTGTFGIGVKRKLDCESHESQKNSNSLNLTVNDTEHGFQDTGMCIF